MRFQDAAPDARAVVYAGIQADAVVATAAALLADAGPAQRILARAVMNGTSTDVGHWRTMFPSLFAGGLAGPADGESRPAQGGDADADRSEAILAVSIAVAERGEQVRQQVRGAIVEAVTELLARRRPTATAPTAVRRERRILFDGVRAEIHPYDVTVEVDGAAEAIDCKWGARGINADVLHQLDDARSHAVDEDERLDVTLVIFDARRSCDVRLARETAPHERTRIVSIEELDDLTVPAVDRTAR